MDLSMTNADRARLRAYELIESRGGSHTNGFKDWCIVEKTVVENKKPEVIDSPPVKTD